MTDCKFITFHGWGFDRNFWNPWIEFLSNYGSVENYDRGYFGEPNEIKNEKKAKSTIVITHSFGLHFVDDELLSRTDLLVITGGFLHFHPRGIISKKSSRFILKQMMKKLEADPEKVLHEFYQKCFAPGVVPFERLSDFNHQRLLDDLERLHQSELKIESLKKVDKICILHGAEDQIVPNQKGRELYNQLDKKARYFEMKNAGHALPFVHYEQCIEFIEPHIEQLLGILKQD